eukprot:5374810-Pyramimonas_sp.AAC.1
MKLCERSDIVVLQECHGNREDLGLLLADLQHFRGWGTFLSSQAAGGSVILIRRSFLQYFVHVKHEVIAKGRCHHLHLRGKLGCMTVSNIHINPSLSNSQKYGLIRQVATCIQPSSKYASWILGDFN